MVAVESLSMAVSTPARRDQAGGHETRPSVTIWQRRLRPDVVGFVVAATAALQDRPGRAVAQSLRTDRPAGAQSM
ncbi:hypothetical protein [Streptomyces sp. NPDC048489]|uniref:hypothetical protein n=1 Tax=Streptomyces sp. NPDC048489 TaxID=3154504 RepID=UPI00342C6725